MTTSDLERRLTAALHQHAENAMSHTRTEEQLQTLLVDAEHEVARRHRRWGTRALVAAAAAAAVVLVVWTSGLDLDRTKAVAPPASSTEVAAAFLDAYGSFDRDRAASYLAPDAYVSIWRDERGFDVWRAGNRWMEAVRYLLLVDSCDRMSSTLSGTTNVVCTFDYHALGSDELGRGPFANSQFNITVLDGKITAVEQQLDFESNGFSAQMWEPFATWVSEAHPRDAATMYADWPSTSDMALNGPSIRLWAQRVQEYVSVEQGGSAGTSSR